MQKHHRGSDHRILVVGDRMVAAAKRVPAFVTGDGKSSVRALIVEKNKAIDISCHPNLIRTISNDFLALRAGSEAERRP